MALLFENDDRLAQRRQCVFVCLNASLFVAGVIPMVHLLARDGWEWMEVCLLAVFMPMLLQIVFGFSMAVTGFWLLRRGGDSAGINSTLPWNIRPGKLSRTAIVMPICNEDVGCVFQRLRIVHESLKKTGQSRSFDFFILSDSGDIDNWIEEEKAWLDLCNAVDGFDHIFYRKRRVPLHNKSGNIADFCRRWGASYRYMIVLDADSLMTGTALVRMVQLMDFHPEVGIIQTCPQLVLGKTLLQRVMQFSSRLYGPQFAAGANYWQMGSGSFWGHNAILRVRPFMQHCAMPLLPKWCLLGRRILSHDTVEAALMRRAGYEVWLADDIVGSYEECPPNLTTMLQRDRRWCFGNLQHLWLVFTPGYKFQSRVHMLNGIMAYVSSVLWLVFLLLSTCLAVAHGQGHIMATTALPSDNISEALLLVYVLLLLFLPKAAFVFLLLRTPHKSAAFGGRIKLAVSVLLEIGFSVLMAPILMFFHARYVLAALTGSVVRWGKQKRRADDNLSWKGLWAAHLGDTLLVATWLGAVAWLAPSFLWMLLVTFLGPLLAVPFARMVASQSVGRISQAKGLFLIPDETGPCDELLEMEKPSKPRLEISSKADSTKDSGILRVLVDPQMNALHAFLLGHRSSHSSRTRAWHEALGQRLLKNGPDALNETEKKALLWDTEVLKALHSELRSGHAVELHEFWRTSLQRHVGATFPRMVLS